MRCDTQWIPWHCRCALLCKAALEAPWLVPCGGAPYGDNNLVFIANDWHTALLPVYLQVSPNPQTLIPRLRQQSSVGLLTGPHSQERHVLSL